MLRCIGRRRSGAGLIDVMAAMNFLAGITINPAQRGGCPCIHGIRMRVKDLLDLLAAGVTSENILRDYLYLEKEDIQAVLEFAAAQSDHLMLRAG